MSAQVPANPGKSLLHRDTVFRWRGNSTSIFPKLFATAFVSGAFALLLTTVNIQVPSVAKTTGRKASVIFPINDDEGRALTLRAQEGGPFPSRFEPSEWQGMAEIETTEMGRAVFHPPLYLPELRELTPDNKVAAIPLAANGVAFFPDRKAAPADPPDAARLKPAPSLQALSGITAAGLPHDLSAFESAVDSAMAGAAWRFILRLNAGGSVIDCVSLEKGTEAGSAELEAWLRRATFAPDPTKPSRWIAVGVSFSNQAADGTDTH